MESNDAGLWTWVLEASELARPGVRSVQWGALRVAVFRLADGRLLALEDRCPHRGARLSGGLVYEGDRVACPDHGWTICLSDGWALPPESGQVRTFPARVAEEGIWLCDRRG